MRQETEYNILNHDDAFYLDIFDSPENFETGNTATIGFDYVVKKEKMKI